MQTKANFILNEALSMSPADRAMVAQCLISSLEEPVAENVDAEWIELAEKRLEEMESGRVEPTTWDAIKNRVLHAEV